MTPRRRAELEEIETRLAGAWSRDTGSLWSAENPARGQCSVTALAVHRLFGGEILMTPTREGPHFYNRIDGERLDFTARQFARPPAYEDRPSDPEAAMADTSPEQLAALLRALERRT